MLRALFELIITIIIVMTARAVLTAVIKGIVNHGAALRNRGSAPSPAQSAGDLHKDPVCGTYVAQSTPHRRDIGGQTFYYCSEACREKHVLVVH